MSKNNQKMAPKAITTNDSNSQVAQLQAANAQLQAVAQEAVNRLLFVENRLSPQLLRKVNFWNILFHWKEVIQVVEEIIRIIKEFKESLQKKDAPA